MAFIKLDTTIKQLCRTTGEPEYRNYDEILELVVSACRQLNLLAVPTVSWEKVSLNSVNAINWPIECIKPIMIGLIRCGRLITLSVEDGILPGNINTNCKNLEEAEKEIDSIATCNNQQYNSYNFDGIEFKGYGYGYNCLGYVTHDKKNRQSYIKGRYKEDDEFLMVFKSDGVSCGLDMIPSETEMCVKTFVLREYYAIKNLGISRTQDQRYKEEFSALRKLSSADTAEDWTELFNNL